MKSELLSDDVGNKLRNKNQVNQRLLKGVKKMSYIISTEENTYNIVDYLHDISTDFSLFNEGISLDGLDCTLKYKAKNKTSFNKIKIVTCYLQLGQTWLAGNSEMFSKVKYQRKLNF